MQTKTSHLLLILILLLGSQAIARTEYNDTAGVSVTFPEAWQMEAEDDDMRLRELDRSSVVLLSVVDATDYHEAAADISEEMSKWIDDSKVSTQKEDSFNGLPALLIEGTGNVKGVQGRWVAVYFEYNSKIIMVVGVAKQRYWDPNVGDVLSIMLSVKPDTE